MPVGVTGWHHSSGLVGFLSFCLSACDQKTATFTNITFENTDLTVLCPNNDRNCSCLCPVNVGSPKPARHVILTVARQKMGIHTKTLCFLLGLCTLVSHKTGIPCLSFISWLECTTPFISDAKPSSPHIWYQIEMPFVCLDQQPDSSWDWREGWILLSVLPSLKMVHTLFNFVLISRDAQAVPLKRKKEKHKPTTNS